MAAEPKQRVSFKHALLERKLGGMGLKPRGAIVAPVTGKAASGFGTRDPIALTAAGLDRLCGLEVVWAGRVPNRMGGEKESLSLSVGFTGPPDEWPRQVLESCPELSKPYRALLGLYALKAKIETRLGREPAAELKAIIADPSRLKAALAAFTANDEPAGDSMPEAPPADAKPARKGGK